MLLLTSNPRCADCKYGRYTRMSKFFVTLQEFWMLLKNSEFSTYFSFFKECKRGWMEARKQYSGNNKIYGCVTQIKNGTIFYVMRIFFSWSFEEYLKQLFVPCLFQRNGTKWLNIDCVEWTCVIAGFVTIPYIDKLQFLS